jgi:hypothetical protein
MRFVSFSIEAMYGIEWVGALWSSRGGGNL